MLINFCMKSNKKKFEKAKTNLLKQNPSISYTSGIIGTEDQSLNYNQSHEILSTSLHKKQNFSYPLDNLANLEFLESSLMDKAPS